MALLVMGPPRSLPMPAVAPVPSVASAVVSRRAPRMVVRCRAAQAAPPPAAAASVRSPSCVLSATRRCGTVQQQQQQQQRRGLRAQSRRCVVAAAQKQQFSSFKDMLNRSEVPVLVDFYATWCGPCQMMSPILASVASKLKGRLQVVKIDTDKYPAIASEHKVQALPTIGLFVGGKMVFRFEGVLQEPQLMERLNYYLAGAGAGKQ